MGIYERKGRRTRIAEQGREWAINKHRGGGGGEGE